MFSIYRPNRIRTVFADSNSSSPVDVWPLELPFRQNLAPCFDSLFHRTILPAYESTC